MARPRKIAEDLSPNFETKESKETFHEFEMKVLNAEEGDFVETSEEIMNAIMKNGLGSDKFFAYKGKLVCGYNKSEEILREMDIPLAERIHGAGEGKVGST